MNAARDQKPGKPKAIITNLVTEDDLKRPAEPKFCLSLATAEKAD